MQQMSFTWSGGNTVDFETFKPFCNKLNGYRSFAKDEPAVEACSFKNERPAESWDDWQKCNEANCPFMRKIRR